MVDPKVVVSDSTYEDLVQEEMLLKRRQLSTLINQGSLLGSYYEEILKETLVKFIPKRYSLATGIIAYNNKNSDQLDIIIYDNSISYPLFSTHNLIVIDPEPVRIVIEVKSVVKNDTIEKAIPNLKSAINICQQSSPHGQVHPLKTILVGFGSDRDLNVIKKRCSDNGIDHLYIFAKIDGRMIPGQFKAMISDITMLLQQFA